MKEWLTFGAKVMAATFAIVAVIALAIRIAVHETDTSDIARIHAKASPSESEPPTSVPAPWPMSPPSTPSSRHASAG
ncbi:MAG TPA: hypothetical protein VGK19_05410 [Capsulimonadaceae bacterium]|jgi:hypothetical protein